MLSQSKCDLFQMKVKYIGHVVSKEGVVIDQDKIDRVVNWPQPTTPERT